MKNLFRLFIVYIFVGHFFDMKVFSADTTSTNSYGQWPVQTPCNMQLNNYNAAKNNLAGKCGGVVLEDCIKEANNCRGSSNESPGLSPLASTLQNTVMAALTGGMPMIGANGPEAFKCAPTIRLDRIISQLDKMKSEAKSTEEKARDYVRKIEDKKDDITNKIADMKKDFAKTIKDSKRAQAELPAKEKELREAAAAQSEDLLKKNNGYEREIGSSLAAIEEKETARGRLYLDTIGKCAQQLAAQKDQALMAYDSEVQKLEDKIVNVYDLNSKYKIQKDFKLKMLKRQKLLQEKYGVDYKNCLIEQSEAYTAAYRRITAEIADSSKGIEHLKQQIQFNLQKLKEIPKNLSSDIKSLKDIDKADRESAVSELTGMNTHVQQLIANYQVQEGKANAEYQQAQAKLNMAQMQQSSNQSIFNMNTFGDAAPMMDALNDAQMLVCKFCRDGSDEKGRPLDSERPDWCNNSDNKKSSKGSR